MFSYFTCSYLAAFIFFPQNVVVWWKFVAEKLRRLNAVLKFITSYILTEEFSDTSLYNL